MVIVSPAAKECSLYRDTNHTRNRFTVKLLIGNIYVFIPLTCLSFILSSHGLGSFEIDTEFDFQLELQSAAYLCCCSSSYSVMVPFSVGNCGRSSTAVSVWKKNVKWYKQKVTLSLGRSI